MSDENDTVDSITEEEDRSRLFQKATLLGLNPARNINTEKLRDMVVEAMKEPEPVVKVTSVVPAAQLNEHGVDVRAVRNDALRLVRVRITCMNPTKAKIESEVFTVSNSYVKVNRVVPIDGREWHIENIILQAMKERKYQAFRVTKNGMGQETRTTELRSEFNIEILPMLTNEQLKDLAIIQAREGDI